MPKRESRRIFLTRTARLTALASAMGFGVQLPAARWLGAAQAGGPPTGGDRSSPVSWVTAPEGTAFNGDDDTHPHEILWNLDAFIKDHGGIPPVTQAVQVAVVGGGMSGLAAAHFLRDLKPVLFEQSPQYGGNAKGEVFGMSRYSLGAAYISIPDEGSIEAALLADLGLTSAGRAEPGDEMGVLMGARVVSPFWQGATDKDQAAEFARVFLELERIGTHAYPSIPAGDGGLSAAQLTTLDKIDFLTWIRSNLGRLHPHVEEFLTLYCWSAFGGSPEELSAAQVLNFLSSDVAGVMVFPGGNSAIASALHSRLTATLGADHMRSSEIVVDVAVDAQGVRITSYSGREKKLKAIHARSCVMAAPKFVAKRIISTLTKEQQEAMNRLHYRAYIVANVIIEGKVVSPGFDLFRLEGTVPPEPRWGDPNPRPFADVCFAGWAASDSTDKSVLTIYEPLPFDGAHQFLFNPNAHDNHRKRIDAGLDPLLAAVGASRDRVLGIRLTRWGHSIPIASTGLLATGDLERACRPIEGKIYFANQDNWANPSFETCVTTAHAAAKAVLGRGR